MCLWVTQLGTLEPCKAHDHRAVLLEHRAHNHSLGAREIRNEKKQLSDGTGHASNNLKSILILARSIRLSIAVATT